MLASSCRHCAKALSKGAVSDNRRSDCSCLQGYRWRTGTSMHERSNSTTAQIENPLQIIRGLPQHDVAKRSDTQWSQSCPAQSHADERAQRIAQGAGQNGGNQHAAPALGSSHASYG